MKRIILAATLLILFISPLQADLVVRIPTQTITSSPTSVTTADVTVLVDVTGTYNMAGYSLQATISGPLGAGAAGSLTYDLSSLITDPGQDPPDASSAASSATSNYLFDMALNHRTGLAPAPHSGFTPNGANNQTNLSSMYGADDVNYPNPGYGIVTTGTYGLVTLHVVIAPGTNGEFDFTLDSGNTVFNDPTSGFAIGDPSSAYPDTIVSLNPGAFDGVINVVAAPEPMTLSLFVTGSLVLAGAIRRRRGCNR
jgi:hypothetical protein